jgi:hypothetical protein
MICPECPVGDPGSGKIGQGKSRHLPIDAKLYYRIVKRLHGIAHLQQQTGVCSRCRGAHIYLIRVIVEPSERTEKDLSRHAKLVSHTDHLDDLFQLIT